VLVRGFKAGLLLLMLLFVQLHAAGQAQIPHVVALHSTIGAVRDLVIQDSLAFLVDSDGSLQILNIANPVNPELLGTYQAEHELHKLSVHGRYAYCASGGAGLLIIDVSSPQTPRLIRQIKIPGFVYDAAVDGSFLYLACAYDGLYVVDCSDPYAPTIVGELPLPGLAFDISVSSGYAYIASGRAGLNIVNVENPYAPQLTTTHPTEGFTCAIHVANSLAYLANGESGFQVMDVSRPTAPLVLAQQNSQPAYAIVTEEDIAFVGGTNVRIYDMRSPRYPYLIGSCETPWPIWAIAKHGQALFTAHGERGWAVVSVDQYASLKLVGEISLPGYAMSVTTWNDYAYVAADSAGVQVVDVAEPTAPFLCGSYGEHACRELAINGNLAFLCDESGGLVIVNVSNPYLPVLVGRFWGESGNPRGVTVDVQRVYLACGFYGMKILESDGAGGVALLGQTSPSDTVWNVAVKGNIAFAADEFEGVLVFDAADPQNPIWLNTIPLYRPMKLAIEGNYLYVACAEYGVAIVDIHIPSMPEFVGRCATYFANDVLPLSDSLALVADDTAGLGVIDTSDKGRAVLLTHYRFGHRGPVWGLARSGDNVLMAAGFGGLKVVSIKALYARSEVKQKHWTLYY
jgi:hypothetical protein